MPNKPPTFRAPAPKRREQRPSSHQRGYTRQWSAYRKRFLSQHPLCVMCLGKGRSVPATEVDHIIAHGGNQSLFWAASNHQPLCKSHHSAKTVAEDGGFGR
ncbi:HNH endonuclease (plasmid) [Planctopirus limnophila DSM 3776]|uniref:HNH endonuclease n=1 Tax=Planctopirus limnophila (strain ATCC 43296 / DSM 3776 / IFAM 1008 / Mu 290) TaxID=521674 RepID=D5SZD5_PLAL2|nr:HNH endonuclease signature motif containing protein [Planctopirus limnophila]ADG70055.1 HNH endonuclease [Planctopirus limnophila DSM 3776]